MISSILSMLTCTRLVSAYNCSSVFACILDAIISKTAQTWSVVFIVDSFILIGYHDRTSGDALNPDVRRPMFLINRLRHKPDCSIVVVVLFTGILSATNIACPSRAQPTTCEQYNTAE